MTKVESIHGGDICCVGDVDPLRPCFASILHALLMDRDVQAANESAILVMNTESNASPDEGDKGAGDSEEIQVQHWLRSLSHLYCTVL